MIEGSSKNKSLVDGNALFSLVMLAVIAMVVSIGAIGIVSIAKSKGTGGASASGTTTVQVTLSEFKVTLSPSSVPAGNVILNIHNAGAAEHNVAAKALSKRVANIPVGGNATLDLGAISSPVELICEVAGHESSGMKATLGIGAASMDNMAEGGETAMTNEEMDAAMAAIAKRFPEKTSAVGGQELAPKILADGTKQFDLTAKIVDWQVDAETTVKAWTYNGQVPGPQLRANVGDKIKIVLKNDLPESTSMHLHGLRVPNAMDGVDPLTQDVIKPGATFVYEFTAKEAAIGMYHSHHNGQVQIPNGLAGSLIISDWKELVMNKFASKIKDANNKIEQEVVMVLNDAGTIGLSLNGKSFPATAPYTMKVGETMLVHYYNEGLMTHPMHLHQPRGLVVAKDGNLLDQPFYMDTLNVAPGERWTVAYTATDKGAWAWHCHILNHAETPQGMKYMVTAVIVS